MFGGKTSVTFAHRKHHILIGMKTVQLGLGKNTLIMYLQNIDFIIFLPISGIYT